VRGPQVQRSTSAAAAARAERGSLPFKFDRFVRSLCGKLLCGQFKAPRCDLASGRPGLDSGISDEKPLVASCNAAAL
jgi:hypothetical protein